MYKLVRQLFNYLGRPNEQKSEKVALAVIYCMFLSLVVVGVVGITSGLQLSYWKQQTQSSCVAAKQ